MSDVPDEAREAARAAGREAWNRAIGFGNAWPADAVDAAVDAAAPFLVAAERQRLHAVEALCDEAERDRIPGMPGAWVRADRLRALVSPVNDDTGGTKP